MTFRENGLGRVHLFTILRLDEAKRFSHFSNFPLLDKDLFQDAIKRAGDLYASFVTLDFTKGIESLNRSLRLDAPTGQNEYGEALSRVA